MYPQISPSYKEDEKLPFKFLMQIYEDEQSEKLVRCARAKKVFFYPSKMSTGM